MKMKIQIISTFLCLCCLMVTGVFGQDVQISGKTYSVISSTALNTKTTYYQLKDKSITGAISQGYVKTGSVYSKTVFTQAEWSAFFQKGTISSLGKSATYVLTVGKAKVKVNYIDKGTTKVIYAIGKDDVDFYEHPGSLETFVAVGKDGGGSGGTSAQQQCIDKVGAEYDECVAPGTDGIAQSDGMCAKYALRALEKCPAAAKPNSSRYGVSTLGLKVTF